LLQLYFSLFIPGYTVNSFWTAQKAALCDAITKDWPSSITGANCTVASISSYYGFHSPSLLVNGYAFFTWKSFPTTAELQAAASIRDSRISVLTTSPETILGNVFPGSLPNCACYGIGVVTTPSTSGFPYTVNITGVPGFTCGAKLTYDGSANGQINQVGVDDGTVNAANRGKYCSTPATSGGVLGVPGSASCRQYGVVSFAPGGTQATATVSVTNGGVSAASVTVGGSGYYTAPAVNISAPNPIPATIAYNLNTAFQPSAAAIIPSINGPYVSAPSVVSLSSTCVDTSSSGCKGIQTTIQINVVARTGTLCLASDISSATLTGTSVTGGLAFPSSGVNIYCTGTPIVTLSTDTLQPSVKAQAVSTVNSITGVVSGITIISAGSGYLSSPPPVVSIAYPSNANFGKLCSPAPIAGLDTSIAYPTPVAITTSGVCNPLGLDTYRNMPCSFPNATGGVTSSLNVGTCNAISSFIALPGPTAAKPCGIVPQTFDSRFIEVPTPVPAPFPSPAPAPCSCPAGPAGPGGPAGPRGAAGPAGPQGTAGFGSACSSTPSTTGSVLGTVTLPTKATFIRKVSSEARCPAGKILTNYDISFGTAVESDAARISVFPTSVQNGYKVGTTITPGSVSFVATIGASSISKAVTITITPTCCTPM
jgi:hypothetical protein